MDTALTHLLDHGVNTRTKLDVLEYYRGNPSALETPGSMSRRLHRAPALVDTAMAQLASARVLRPSRPNGGREAIYAFSPSRDARQCLELLWTALAGPERAEVLAHIMQRDVEVRAHEVADLQRLDDLKNRFIALVSHKLRTPVTVLKGALEMLLVQPDMPAAKRTKLLELADKHSGELIALIESLLALAGLQSGRPLELDLQPSSLAETIEEAVARLPDSEQEHQITTDLADLSGPVVMDRDKIAVVVDDLLDNARKFSPAGGLITISAAESQGYAQVTIDDEGIGLPAAEVDRVFERFYQFQAEGEGVIPGAGIGLYLAREVVNAHGGRIWIEKKSGPGLRVHFSLPVRGPRPPEGRTAPSLG